MPVLVASMTKEIPCRVSMGECLTQYLIGVAIGVDEGPFSGRSVKLINLNRKVSFL